MPLAIRFVLYLAAFIAFIYESIQTRSLIAIGLTLWVSVPLWVTTDKLL